MRRIGLTQRVDVIKDYNECRGSLDQRWHELLLMMDILPVPLPNIDSCYVQDLVDDSNLDGVILTGGNSLAFLNPDSDDASPIRDKFELALIAHCIKHNLPILGVCRGMQIINYFFAGSLKPISGHVNIRHKLRVNQQRILFPVEVNSFHAYSITEDNLGNDLNALALDNEGNVEAFEHASLRISGMMWHPEREISYRKHDINFIKRALI
jgi:putative glutamine amidotransferase